MVQEPEFTPLLREIRDLLIPVSAHYRPEYEERLRIKREAQAARLCKVARGAKVRKACELMNGMRSQAEVAKGAQLDQGTTSKLVSRLSSEGLLDDGDRRKPRLIFTRDELAAIWETK